MCAQDYADRQVDASLSGEESKRIEIATVLARKGAGLLIFDEPEAGIDLWSFSGLIDVFQRMKNRKQGSALIISIRSGSCRLLTRSSSLPTVPFVPPGCGRKSFQPCWETKIDAARWKGGHYMNKITETLLGLVSD